MTSLLPLDTSSTSVQGEDESQQQQQEQCTTTIAAEMPGNGTQSNNISPTTTPFASPPAPTRIPHPNVPLRRSATMRLRSTKQQQQMQAELGSLPTGEFSTRAKLTPSSSPTPTPCPRKLTRNRTWCPLGHSAEQQQQQQRKDTQQAQGDAARVQQQHQQNIREACSDIQFELHTSLDNMAASSAASKSSRNMSLKLNGSSSDPATNLTATSTPKTPKTLSCSELSTPACAGSTASGHTCVRESHCARSTSKGSRKQEIISTKLSTVPEAKISPKTPPGTPDSPSTYLDDDLDSMYSFATTTSGRSTMSCEHPYVARNGTTFSGRKMKYVVHCSNYAGQVGDDYLTPTQRAQRQIRRLKELLSIARQDLETKDTEILRLTREVVELRLFKASLSSPEERSASSDAVTVREAELKTSQDVSPIVDMVDEAKCSPRHLARQQQQQLQQQEQQQQQQHQQQHQQLQMSAEMQSSYADSGHFEDLTVSSVHSKDSQTQSDIPEVGASSSHLENYEMQRQELIRMYEQRIEELIRTQDGATSDMKRSHNDKVEALLQKLAECNTRYSDIVPDYEHAKQRIRELEKQLEDLQRKLVEHEEKQNRMYLHMYQQGQEAERLTRADQAMELAQRQPDSKVSINELLHQLQSTQDELENIRASECRMRECGSNHALLTAKEAISLWVLGARKTIYRRLLEAQKNRTRVDPEVTLQFLKSAIFYFLTDKENSQGHLQAIESILEFTDEERDKISHARLPK